MSDHDPLDYRRIFGLCLVKDEEDIIAQSLQSAAKWCTAIFVYDNGSEDKTWSIISELSRCIPNIIPFRQDSAPYSNSLRAEIFEYVRGEARVGDWWCQLDADEFYIDNPKVFLAKVAKPYDVVWSASFQYYFTDRDLLTYENNPKAFDDDVPIEQKCRYYRNNWSEPRFFRHSDNLKYRNRPRPYPLYVSYPDRIRLKHFQYRSPKQIDRRFASRRDALIRGQFRHERNPDWNRAITEGKQASCNPVSDYIPLSWRERIVKSEGLNYDDLKSPYVIQEDKLPFIYNLDSAVA